MASEKTTKLVWYKVLDNPAQLPEGRVMTVTAGHKGICLTHVKGEFGGLDNKCPHQGGPLGEGSIENGLLRCPWHGWDYDPITGKAPGFDDGVETYPVEVREDGIYIGLEEERPHEPTVSDVMAETMVNWGIDSVFGMVGHSNLGLADALRRQEEKGNLKFIGIRHEGAAAFAASAYAKLTGQPAACFAIAGPGATNLLTGCWDAKVDRAPLLALTGQVDSQVLGTGNFQEVDLSAAFSGVAQFSHVVLTNSRHAELMNLAIKSAVLKRDVSHLIFPDEVQVIPAGNRKAKGPQNRITSQAIHPPTEQLNQALGLIRSAKRPVIIVGHGSRFHMNPITAFAEHLNCPVLTTFKGKGLIPDRHPLGGGVLGRSGTPIASWFMNEADLLIVLGASFSKHTGITPKIPTIQVDFDPMALAKFHQVDCQVFGELGVTVDAFRQGLGSDFAAIDQREEIAHRWSIWRDEKANRLKDNQEQGLSSIAVFDALTRHCPENAAIAVDVGNNTYSFGRYFECTAQSIVMSGYLGSIGFAYPAAMGLWAAVKDERPILAISGDGGFAQYMGEVQTAVKYNMPIKHILLNNGELGKISKEQRAGEFDVWKTSLTNCNYAEYSKLCGAMGVRVSDPAKLDEALEMAFSHNGPFCVEIMTNAMLI
ncbi:MAG: thiamine pyrophosphate-binding protein [Bacteroidota bacterium]